MTKTRKTEPAVMTMQFDFTIANGDPKYIDISQCASLLNRRFYRQGINWVVSGFKFLTASGASGTFGVSKLQHNWVMAQAWKKAFALWNKQQMEVVDQAGAESAVARFRDFKIHADVNHVTSGFGGNLLPSVGTIGSLSTAVPGDWEASQIVIPNIVTDAGGSQTDPREYTLHMHGINNNAAGPSRGIVEGYADSRAYPQSPDPVSPPLGSSANWMRDMFDVGNDNVEIMQNATDRNDELPYPQVDYPGGENQLNLLELHDFAGVTATTIGGTTLMRGGAFPCGLIRIDWNGDPANVVLLVNMVPGAHRGYLCEKMQDV